jgi:hypothetical protein
VESSARELVGLSVFDPKFPGAFPFRVRELDVAAPLLKAMRRHVPTDDYVHLVTEDDERLSDLLCRAGAKEGRDSALRRPATRGGVTQRSPAVTGAHALWFSDLPVSPSAVIAAEYAVLALH